MGKTVPKGNASTYTETAGDKMGIIKRRTFLQTIASVVFGGGAALKAKKNAKVMSVGDYAVKQYAEDMARATAQKTSKLKPIGKSATDICNEALEKIRPADGKYLDVDDMKCLNCSCWIHIPKGFYVPGDMTECGCGNRARFVLFAKVKMESNHGSNNQDS